MKFPKKIKLIWILIIFMTFVYTTIYFLYGSIKSQEIAYDIKDGLIENVKNIQIIEYTWLDEKYKDIISEDEFKNAKTTNDYLSLFQKINSVKCTPNVFQKLSINSTDYGKKEASQIITDNNGTKYFVMHHIDVVSSFSFKPKIVNWTIDITEIKE